MLSSYMELLKGMPLLVRAWQSVVYWIREWKIASVFLPLETHEHNEKSKRYDTKDDPSRLVGVQYATGAEEL